MKVATSDIDLFSDATLRDTPHWYGVLREAGAMLHLPRNELYAVTRYDAVRQALRADAVLVSSRGVAANDGEPTPLLNNVLQGFAALPARLLAA